MKITWFQWPATLLAGILAVHGLGLVATAAPQQGADKPAGKAPTPPPVDKAEVDQHLYDSLRDVINQGASLYNKGDATACYNLFRSALVAAWYMVDHHPDLRRDITAALARADGQSSAADRALTLRTALDATRDRLRTNSKKGPEVPTPAKPAPATQTTLWTRLGEEAGVRKVVDDFVALAGSDPKVDFTRGGKYPLTPDKLANLKTQLVNYISDATGGPLKYTGLSMRASHRSMGITDAEFEASVADLRKALERNHVKPTDIEALVRMVGTTRVQIVQPKAAEDKKPAANPKPEDKKPVNPKPEDAKPPETNKGTDQKPVNKPSFKDDTPRSTDTVDIKGTVTYKGVPLDEVVVRFVPKDERNLTKNALTTKTGAFVIKDILTGEYTVTITDPGKNTIPKEYGDAAKSTLKYKVTKENKLFVIELK